MTPHAGGFWKKIFWVGRSENFNFGGAVVLRGSVSAVKVGGGGVRFFWKMKNCIITVYKVCDAVRDLVLFVQFKKRGKRPWRSAPFSIVAGFSNVSLWACLMFF